MLRSSALRAMCYPPSTKYSSSNHPSLSSTSAATPWQATDNINVQEVTRKALIYELIHQQSETIQAIVPWFLDNMPYSYFKQVPEQFAFNTSKRLPPLKTRT
jgi:hypothetical protein